MSLKSAMVTLRQYRFEISFVLLASALATVLGATIAIRLDALHVSKQCIDSVNASQDGFSAGADCFNLVRAGSEILGSTFMKSDGTLQLSIMGLLPFVLGLFGGMPIVARELEDHTAQMAWSLNSSRPRWLIRQMVPVVLVVGVAAAVVGLVAIPVADGWVRWYQGEAAQLIGAHGPLVVIRALSAFGIGVAVGAALGRTFPAFVVSAALILILLLAAGQAREVWLSSLPQEVLATYSADTHQWTVMAGSRPRDIGYVAPDGAILSQVEARAIATAAGVPPRQPDDPIDTPAATWLAQNGYAEVPLGVTDQTALGWAPYDGVIFGVIGTVGLASAFVLVNRRRPT